VTQPNRVLVVDTARGVWGAQAYLLRLAEPLAGRGYELVLAAPDALELSAAWRERGLPFVAADLPLARSVRGDRGRIDGRALAREARVLRDNVREIARLARTVGAGAIWANGHAVHLDAALAGRLARLPSVLHLHEEMAPRFGQALRAAAVTIAPAALAVSQAVADGLPAPLAARVEVVPNGVDVTRFTPGPADAAVRAALGAGPEDVLLVAATRLDPEKRIEDLIAALAPLRAEPGWHLAIVGATSTYPEYAERVQREARATLGERVTFAGRREDVAAVLRAADVLVHAGVVEGMPLGVIEAQASGVPVVAYRVAGIPESVVDGRTALLAEPRDAAALGRHVGALLDDPGRRRQLGAAARVHATTHHDLERQADRQAAMLDRVVGRERPTAPRVLLTNHWHDDNRGDSAITQGILTLLRSVAPHSRVTVTTLTESGALWEGSTRHLERFWPGLRAVPSPVPTELRGRAVERGKPQIAWDIACWWLRLVPGLVRRSPWRPHVEPADLVVLVGAPTSSTTRACQPC